ncbi:AMIN domain-containing protein [Desulfocastanea catecholica]
MKWLASRAVTPVDMGLLLVVFVIGVLLPSTAFAELEQAAVITSISHRKHSAVKETITLTLTARIIPKIFTIQGDNPRLVLDFPQSDYQGKNVIALPDSGVAAAIRIGFHQTPVRKTRVVVDLSKDMPVHYDSEYFAQENTLVVTLTSATAEPQHTVIPKPSLQSPKALPSREETSAGPLDEKNVPPVFSDREGAEEPAAEGVTASVRPTILEISFDDSSGKGEMALFRLNDFFPPTVSAIEKSSPRVFCDFMATDIGPEVDKFIATNGQYIERIRTVRLHDPEQVRVVLELSPDRDYELHQVFFRNDNLFVLIVNEMTAAKLTGQ